MLQGAVGTVRLVEWKGETVIEKRMGQLARHDTEVAALRALMGSELPAPELVRVEPGRILMTRLPGERLDRVEADERLRGLRDSATLLRRLHELPAPAGLPGPPDDALIIRRYRDSEGPALPLRVPPAHRAVFCHGDWTDGNLLAENGSITGIVDWEKAHLGDPLRDLSRAAWAAGQKDRRSFDTIVDAYGADRDAARAWSAIHAAELWLWFAEAGPPAYLAQLTAELQHWSDPAGLSER